MSRRIPREVIDKFQENPDTLREYLSALRSSISEMATSVRRSAVSCVALIGIFLLLVGHSSVQRFTVGPIVFSGNSVVLIAIPAGVAYFYYEALLYMMRMEENRILHDKLLPIFLGVESSKMLNRFLSPQAPSFFMATSNQEMDERFEKILSSSDFSWRSLVEITRISPVGMFGTIVGVFFPLAFEVYAFVALFERNGFFHFGVWLSIIVSCIYIAATWADLFRWGGAAFHID